jgi:FixJ family two-component response regulator
MPVKILLVEDEALIAISERTVLEQEGYTVTIARSGEEAVEFAATESGVNLVLMDIDLGVGIEGRGAALPGGLHRLGVPPPGGMSPARSGGIILYTEVLTELN